MSDPRSNPLEISGPESAVPAQAPITPTPGVREPIEPPTPKPYSLPSPLPQGANSPKAPPRSGYSTSSDIALRPIPKIAPRPPTPRGSNAPADSTPLPELAHATVLGQSPRIDQLPGPGQETPEVPPPSGEMPLQEGNPSEPGNPLDQAAATQIASETDLEEAFAGDHYLSAGIASPELGSNCPGSSKAAAFKPTRKKLPAWIKYTIPAMFGLAAILLLIGMWAIAVKLQIPHIPLSNNHLRTEDPQAFNEAQSMALWMLLCIPVALILLFMALSARIQLKLIAESKGRKD